MYIDLSQIPTPVLKEIKRVLQSGSLATSEVKAGNEARKYRALAEELRKENAEMKKRERYREFVLSYGLDFDDDPEYWLRHSEEHLKITCEKLAEIRRKAAFAEKTRTMKIPSLSFSEREPELSSFEYIRKTLEERRNGRC